jgi:hypothetical protein
MATVEIFPEELLEVQRALLDPYFQPILLDAFARHPDASNQMEAPEDLFVLLATYWAIPLDGEYTPVELANLILPKIRDELRMAKMIYLN